MEDDFDVLVSLWLWGLFHEADLQDSKVAHRGEVLRKRQSVNTQEKNKALVSCSLKIKRQPQPEEVMALDVLRV